MAKKWFSVVYSIAPVFILAAAIIIFPGLARADTDPGFADQEPALIISGDGVTDPQSFTWDDLRAMEQYPVQVFSAINSYPTKKFYIGKGVRLRDLLSEAGIKEEAGLIRVYSHDEHYSNTFTVKELLEDARYYYPAFMENTSKGEIPGSGSGAVQVEAMIALESAEDSRQEIHLNDVEALHLLYGQRAVTEQTNQGFTKNIREIEVLTSIPAKWSKPSASIESGKVPAGTKIELNVLDDAKIYYTTDGTEPTLDSPIYNWCSGQWLARREDRAEIMKPFEINEPTVIKTMKSGPGKEDSEVAVFVYEIGEPDYDLEGPPAKINLEWDASPLQLGESRQAVAYALPKNAGTRLVWSTEDLGVISLNPNNEICTLNAVGIGTAGITVSTADGEIEISFAVRVIKENVVVRQAGGSAGTLFPGEGQDGRGAGQTVRDQAGEVGGETSTASAGSSGLTEENTDSPAEPRETVSGEEEATEEDSEFDETENEENASDEEENEAEESAMSGKYLMAKDDMALDETEKEAPNAGFDGAAWQIYELTPEQEINLSQKVYMGAVLGGLFCSGAGRRYRKHMREGKH